MTERPILFSAPISDGEAVSGLTKRVLDPCCGSRMMWFDRTHPDVVFGDQRAETLTVTDRSHGRADGTRTLKVDPDPVRDKPRRSGRGRIARTAKPSLPLCLWV